jgi:DNA-binding phage protein
MALTRDFRNTILERAQNDARFRESLFTEAINAYLSGDTGTGKAILRDLVNATVGFESLAAEIKKPSKSLHRMLAPHGNPSTENFFGIVSVLQNEDAHETARHGQGRVKTVECQGRRQKNRKVYVVRAVTQS